MTNSFRPCRLASPRWNGEARTRDEREALDADSTGDKAIGWSGVVIGDGEPGRCGEPATRLDRVVKRRDPRGRSQGVSVEGRINRKPGPRAGVTALIVALKPGNAGGAKGGAKGGSQGGQEGGDVMSGTNGTTPVTVPGATPGKRAGEARHGQPRAEPTVWTARMLAALEQGVKACPWAGRRLDPRGGEWHSLIDKLYPLSTPPSPRHGRPSPW